MRHAPSRSLEPTDLYFWICIFVPSPHLHDFTTSSWTTRQSIYSFTFDIGSAPHRTASVRRTSRELHVPYTHARLVVAGLRPSIFDTHNFLI